MNCWQVGWQCIPSTIHPWLMSVIRFRWGCKHYYEALCSPKLWLRDFDSARSLPPLALSRADGLREWRE